MNAYTIRVRVNDRLRLNRQLGWMLIAIVGCVIATGLVDTTVFPGGRGPFAGPPYGISKLATLGGLVFFAANDPSQNVGDEPWVSDGIVSLPADEAANLLLPLLQDKLEFIRREAAYALGETRSRSAVMPLANLLTTDKEASVRAAAAIALGRIGDESAEPALTRVLSGSPGTGKKKPKGETDSFVMSAAARSLGQIRRTSSVNVLIATLANDSFTADIRREAAAALGQIGDSSAIPALRNALASGDPYLSEAARAALRKLHAAVKN